MISEQEKGSIRDAVLFAKNPRKQVKIEADLHAVKESVILDILGVDSKMKLPARGKVSQPEEPQRYKTQKLDQETIDRILALADEGGHSQLKIAQMVGCALSTVSRYIGLARKNAPVKVTYINKEEPMQNEPEKATAEIEAGIAAEFHEPEELWDSVPEAPVEEALLEPEPAPAPKTDKAEDFMLSLENTAEALFKAVTMGRALKVFSEEEYDTLFSFYDRLMSFAHGFEAALKMMREV